MTDMGAQILLVRTRLPHNRRKSSCPYPLSQFWMVSAKQAANQMVVDLQSLKNQEVEKILVTR